jgi:hypothetical protein
MAIEAKLFDGTTLEFPDGTDPSVIQSTAKRLTLERQQPEPSYDPMSGIQITDIAPKIDVPKPTLLTGTTAPKDILPTGEYLPTTDNPLQRVYDASTPLQREELAAKDPRFKPIHEFYLAQDLINKTQRPDQFYKPMVPADTFDTRLEARKSFLMGQGLAPDFAEATAQRQAMAGAGKMTPYGEVREAPPEYDIEREYRMRPEMTGIEETAQFLKRSSVKGGSAILKGAGGVNMFVGDLLGLDTTDTKRTLDDINRYTQAIGVSPSKPIAIFENAVESIAQQMPALVGGVMTGSQIPVLISMFAQSFGQTYDDSKRMGMNTSDAAQRSGLYASFEVLGEKFGLGDTLKGIKAIAQDIPTKDLSTFFAKALVKEIPGEQLTYAGQFATDKGFGVNPEAGIKEFLQGSADTLVATVAQGSLMIGGGAAAQQAIKAMGAAKKPEEVITPQMEQKLERTREELGGKREEPVAPEATTVAPEATPELTLPKTYDEYINQIKTEGLDLNDPETAAAAKQFWEENQAMFQQKEPVPPEVGETTVPVTPESKALDKQAMLAELPVNPQTVVKEAIKNPSGPAAQVLDNVERQQTQTPQFKQWFGDSKVKDKAGKPLVVYHGTTQDIKSFDPSKSFGNLGASFFTEDPKFASSFDYTQGKGNILPVYLSANNIFDFGNKEQRDLLKQAASKIEIRDPVRGFTTLDTKIPDSEQYFDTEHPEVFKLIKDIGYDGVKLKERGVTNYAVFNPTQIKSAIGNKGTFSKVDPSIIENIERTSVVPAELLIRTDRTPSLRTEITRLKNLFEKGRISSDIVANQISRLLEDTKKERTEAKRERGGNLILEKMNRAVRRGELDQQAVDFATWFIGKNPNVADDIAISIKKAGENTPSATYNSMSRLVTLFKDSGNSESAVHEILHHSERMMPEKVQIGIRKLWLKRMLKNADKANKGDDVALKDYFKNVIDFHLYDDMNAMREAKKAVSDGSVDYSNYQFFSPSEFWAVNATEISQSRFEGDKSFMGKLKQWLREFGEKAKSLFGLDSNAPIIRALDSLAKGDGKFKSQLMLTQGQTFENVKRTFKAKKTGQEVSREATPELYSFTMPEREDFFFGFKKDDILYHLFDQQIDTKRLQTAIENAGNTIDDMFNAYQKETLYHGKVAAQIGDFVKGEVLPLVREMNKLDIPLESLEEYLHMRHAEERNDKMNERNIGNTKLQDQGSGVHTDKAREYLKNLPKEKKEQFEALADKVYDIIKETQDILVRSGAEEEDLINTWRKTYKDYVPLFRADDDFVSPPGTQMGSGFQVRGSTNKRATGSTKEVVNILGNVIAQRERAIVRQEKMKVGHALYGLAITNPQPDFWYAFNPDAVKSKKAARQELIDFGVQDVDAVMNLIDAPRTPFIDKETGQVGYKLSPLTLAQDNAFPVRINGKDRYIFFNRNNPEAMRMARAISGLDIDKLDAATTAIGAVSHWIAAVNTQYNPVFGMVNLVRDSEGAMLNLASTELKGMQKAVASKIPPSLNTIRKVLKAERRGIPLDEAFKKSTPEYEDAMLFKQFRDDGGQTGYRDMLMRRKEEEQLVEQELKKYSDNKFKRAGRKIAQGLSDFNDVMENSVRFAAYKTAIAPKSEGGAGLSRDKGAYIAKELTVNFDRKGRLAKRINSYYIFFNAGLRGTARIYETLTSPAGKKIMTAGVGLGVIQAVILSAYPDDDPPEFIRAKNFVIPAGENRIFTIPYPLGYNVFPSIGRIGSEFMFGDRKAGSAFTGMAGAIIEAFNPLGGGELGYRTLVPTVLKIPVSVAENKDMNARPIYKPDRASDPTPGYTRSSERASSISQGVSYALNYLTSGFEENTKGKISPTADEIDYYAGQVTGGVGRELAKTRDMVYNMINGEETPSYRIPLVGRFYGDVDTNSTKAQRFFNNVVEMSQHEHEIKNRKKYGQDYSEYIEKHPEAALWTRVNSVENQISKLRQERRDLKERGADEEYIKAKADRIIELMDNINEQISEAKK